MGVERLFGNTLMVGLKGTYRSLASALEDRCDFEEVRCVLINPGSGAKYASGNAPVCTGAPPGSCVHPTGPATPEAKRYYRGIEILARESIGTSLWLQASYIYSSLRGNYDGAVNERRLRPDDAGCQHRLRLFLLCGTTDTARSPSIGRIASAWTATG